MTILSPTLRFKTSRRGRISQCLLLLMLMLFSTACVHQDPVEPMPEPPVKQDPFMTLTVTHTLDWTWYEMTMTRAASGMLPRYHFQVFKAGDTDRKVWEKSFTTSDMSRSDFTTDITLPVGAYDLYAWSDYADADSENSLFFDTSDFTAVNYAGNYTGNSDSRDAFRGFLTFSLSEDDGIHFDRNYTLQLERPMARYEFRATDILEFIDRETTRGVLTRVSGEVQATGPSDIAQKLPELGKYRVKMIYTGYMPSKFNNILNRPVDSSTGVTYDATINILSEEEARLGFDYVMVNGSESSVPVAMEIYDPKGQLIGRTNPIDVPTKRGRTTIVRGRFLTSQASGGVGINPDFNGDFNIEIK